MIDILRRFSAKMLAPTQSPDAGLPYWRERAFLNLFTFGMVVGTFIYAPSVAFLAWAGDWRMALLDTGVYGACLILYLARGITYQTKAGLLITVIFGMGVAVLAVRGPLSAGPIWLFSCPLMAAVLLGRRPGLMALAANGAVMTAIWWLGGEGLLPWARHLGVSPFRMMIITVNFLFINAVAGFIANAVVSGIEYNNAKLREALDDLSQEMVLRRRAEDELRRSEETYRQTVQNSPNIICSVDGRGRLASMNPAGLKKLVVIGEDWAGREFSGFLARPEHRQRVDELVRRVFNGESVQGEELDLVDRSGQSRQTLARLYPLEGTGGQVSRCVISLTDITERKQAEQALQLEQERLQALLELHRMSQADISEVTDFALEKGVELTGSNIGYLAVLSEDETVLTMHSWSRQTLTECAIPDKPKVFQLAHTGLWGEAVRRREPMIVNDYQVPSPHKKGLPPGHVQLTRILNVPVIEGERIVALAGVGNKQGNYDQSDVRQLTLLMQGMWRMVQRRNDEKHRLRLEEQLRQAQKMEAVGTLAGGIAHDFNNILAAIIGYTELAQSRHKTGKDTSDELAQVLSAATRARDLVQQILTFSRLSPRALKPLDLNQVVRQGLNMLARTIPRMVDIHSELADGLAPIAGDPAQIEQVVINLGINAADAMPEGGTLTVKSESILLDERYCRDHAEVEPGRYLRLTMSDTGQGMEDDTLERIFDPFFTTKEVGKGTGLGLSSVYGIVKDHGGHITCRSRPGAGTSFDIYLPEDTAGLPVREAASAPAIAARGAGETVLVVDDEPSLRDLGRRVLESAGYRTLLAESGESALEQLRAGNGGVDLVILDLSMPGMGGRRCLAEILRMDPAARVVVASGYSEDTSLGDVVAQGAAAFVAKPYGALELLDTVRRVLDNPDR